MLPRPMKFDLQLRDLKTGKTSQKTFESLEDGLAWLKERPKFNDVMGVASHHMPRETEDQLRKAMRPLDDEEKALDKKLREEREKDGPVSGADLQWLAGLTIQLVDHIRDAIKVVDFWRSWRRRTTTGW